MKTLIEILATVAAQNSNRIAVVEGQTAVSYSDLEKAIVSLAAQLSELGIRPGDRVAILLPNGSEFIISYFAIVLVRGIVVPLNEQYQQSELSHFLKETASLAHHHFTTVGEFMPASSPVERKPVPNFSYR